MVDAATRRLVRLRADERCEYCQRASNETDFFSLHVEHIVPKKHRGDDDPENLALACADCNLCKATNLAGLDPQTGKLTPLFHPRKHDWNLHFEWIGVIIVGKTDIGRTTVGVLNLNSEERILNRSEVR